MAEQTKRERTDEHILINWKAFAADKKRSPETAIQMTADASGVKYWRVIDALHRQAVREGKIDV